MEDKITIEFDLTIMTLEEVKKLKYIVIHQQEYEKASYLRDYEKHLIEIEKNK